MLTAKTSSVFLERNGCQDDLHRMVKINGFNFLFALPPVIVCTLLIV